MFAPGTVIVLGAGASLEANFPLGSGLIDQIRANLENTLRRSDEFSHDIMLLMQALNGFSRPIISEILLGLKHANSIDSYLFSRSDSPDIVRIGKICIAHALLNAEKNSYCYYDFRDEKMADENKMHHTHYETLFRIAKDGIDKSSIDKLFCEFTVINFNYDRSLKHYLMKATKEAFGISSADSANCVKRLKILQPYGGLGLLPWEGGPNTPYGTMNLDIGSVSNNIYTFSEDHSKILDLHDEVKTVIGNAKKLILLGFGFHKQNMELLRPKSPGMVDCTNIYSTSVGISHTDKTAIKNVFSTWQTASKIGRDAELLFNDIGCVQLFAESRLSMTE